MDAQADWKLTQRMPSRSSVRQRLSNAAIALLVSVLSTATSAQSARPPEELQGLLAFESAAKQDLADRWHGLKQGVAHLDEEVVHDGQRSVRIERDTG